MLNSTKSAPSEKPAHFTKPYADFPLSFRPPSGRLYEHPRQKGGRGRFNPREGGVSDTECSSVGGRFLLTSPPGKDLSKGEDSRAPVIRGCVAHDQVSFSRLPFQNLPLFAQKAG